MKFNVKIIFVLLFIMIGLNLYAQMDSGISTGGAAQYYLGAEDELLVPINIWGFVLKPGQYMVPNNTDLVSLLSYAGGPNESAKITNIQIVRSDQNTGNMVLKINVKKYLDTADPRLIPTLKPGDTIIVKATTYYWISRFFEFVSRFSAFAMMYYYIDRTLEN